MFSRMVTTARSEHIGLKDELTMIRKLALITLVVIALVSICACQDNVDQPSITKTEIIKSFVDHADKFEAIQKYAEETDGYLYVDDGGEMGNTVEGECSQAITNKDVKKDIQYLIDELRVAAILEYKAIKFQYTSGIEQGILYLKDERIPAGVFESEQIIEHWYYYMTHNV